MITSGTSISALARRAQVRRPANAGVIEMGYSEQLVLKTNQVRQLTESSCPISSVEKYATGFNSWLQDPPVPSRPIWGAALFESSVLAEASYFLAAHGFYEEACAVLRGLLDGFLARLHWDTLDKNGKLRNWTEGGRSTNAYWEWESGETAKYPMLTDIWRTLLGEHQIERYDERHGLRAEVDEELATLNRFVHGRPHTRHYPGASRSSLCNIEFRREHFEEWYEHLRTVYRLVSILSVLQYPQLLGSAGEQEFRALQPEAADQTASVLGSTPAHDAS